MAYSIRGRGQQKCMQNVSHLGHVPSAEIQADTEALRVDTAVQIMLADHRGDLGCDRRNALSPQARRSVPGNTDVYIEGHAGLASNHAILWLSHLLLCKSHHSICVIRQPTLLNL